MSKTGEIIRGDTQTVSIPVDGLFDDLTGATAHFIVDDDDGATDSTVVPASPVIHVELGPFVSDVDELDFEIPASDTLVPVGEYVWYARVEEADGTITTIRFKPRKVEVTAPGDEDC